MMHAVLYASLVSLSFAATCPAQTSTPVYLSSQIGYSDAECCKYNSQCAEGCCDSVTWTCLDRSKGFDLMKKNQANTCKMWSGAQAQDLNSYLEIDIKLRALSSNNDIDFKTIGIIYAVGVGIAIIIVFYNYWVVSGENMNQNDEIKKNIQKMLDRIKQLGGLVDIQSERNQVGQVQPYGQPINPQMQQHPPVNQVGQNQQMGQFGHPGYAQQQQPVYAQQQPVYAQQQPVYAKQQPVYAQQQPVYAQQQPVYVQQQPVYAQQQPVYAQQQPVYAQQQPVYVQQQPVYVQQQPVFVQKQPVFVQQQLELSQQYLVQDQQQPVYGQPVQGYPNELQDV